jgi:hypothetical protein
MHILHATAVLVIAFFVWFAASRSDGLLKTLGRVLGAWLIVVAVALIVFGFVGPKHHGGNWMSPASDTAAASNAAAPANTAP